VSFRWEKKDCLLGVEVYTTVIKVPGNIVMGMGKGFGEICFCCEDWIKLALE
jgi:RNA recognition motif-containing protein